jgi:hypothetical protein
MGRSALRDGLPPFRPRTARRHSQRLGAVHRRTPPRRYRSSPVAVGTPTPTMNHTLPMKGHTRDVRWSLGSETPAGVSPGPRRRAQICRNGGWVYETRSTRCGTSSRRRRDTRPRTKLHEPGRAWLVHAYTGHAGVVTAFLSDTEATRSGHEMHDFVPKQRRGHGHQTLLHPGAKEYSAIGGQDHGSRSIPALRSTLRTTFAQAVRQLRVVENRNRASLSLQDPRGPGAATPPSTRPR